ncbi:hypothetical protein VNO77_24344 [Canavalia gladiata]|uniref:Uncharacterized protein n=1 Tax=Canavalia gladiata TaxID=3824 RepID=A0AAN9LBF6_CANGL
MNQQLYPFLVGESDVSHLTQNAPIKRTTIGRRSVISCRIFLKKNLEAAPADFFLGSKSGQRLEGYKHSQARKEYGRRMDEGKEYGLSGVNHLDRDIKCLYIHIRHPVVGEMGAALLKTDANSIVKHKPKLTEYQQACFITELFISSSCKMKTQNI